MDWCPLRTRSGHQTK